MSKCDGSCSGNELGDCSCRSNADRVMQLEFEKTALAESIRILTRDLKLANMNLTATQHRCDELIDAERSVAMIEIWRGERM